VPEGTVASKLQYLISPFEIDLLEADLTPPPPEHIAVASSFAPGAAWQYRQRGDTAEQYGYSLSVSSVQDPAQAGSIYSPKEYCRLVGVEIVLRNVSGSAALGANLLFAFLVDENGFVYTAEIGGVDGQIDSIDLAEGEQAKGWVSFPSFLLFLWKRPEQTEYRTPLRGEHSRPAECLSRWAARHR
jgi:hypothetical protein